MAVGDQYRRISPADQLVFDSTGALSGVKSGVSGQSEGRMLTAATATAVQALVSGAGELPPGQSRVLKATTGALQLTGGTAGVKTTLLTVALPDGLLSDPTVRLVIEYATNYTNSANVKNYGIDIGSTAGTAVTLRSQAPTTTASETTLFVMQRSTTTPARFWIALPNNARVFGTAPGSGATSGVLASASIDPAATGQNLYFWAQINPNTEQITFETIYVKLEKAVS